MTTDAWPLLRLARRVLLVANAFALLLVVCLVAGYRRGPEQLGFFSIVQYVPYPVMLLPLMGLGLLSLFLRARSSVLSMAAITLTATSFMGLEWHQGEPGSRPVRVMTFNIKDYVTLRSTTGLAELRSEIARHNPDIFMLQDARSFNPDRIRLDDARSMFGDRTSYAFGQYVIASRYPLRDCRSGWISFRDEPHTYATCVVTIDGIDVDLITTHFMTPRFGLAATRFNLLRGVKAWSENIEDRMTQSASLASDIRARTRPVIVAGDLNAPQSSLVVRTLLDTGLRDAFSVAGRGFGFTWGHSLRPHIDFLRIDHILTSKAFHVGSAFVGDAAGSAHRPVVADLYLTSPE